MSSQFLRKLNPSFLPTFCVQGVGRSLALWHIDDSVDVERDLLRGRGPVLVAEAVNVLSVDFGVKRMVAIGHATVVVLVVSVGVLDLNWDGLLD